MKTNQSGALTLVVDTNLFLECRPLEQLPWDDLGFDEISLIVPRPVQQEIDNHKKGIKGRTFKKALTATTLLRGIVVAGQPLVVREDAPRVTLSLMAQSKIDATLAEDLDPGCNDDAIILRLLQYARNHPSDDVRLLTHDTGPMATAQSVGVGFVVIPDEWLPNNHDDPATKENLKLQAEVKRFRSQEPVFLVNIRDGDGAVTKRLNAEIDHYEELTTEDVDALMVLIRKEYPVEIDFGSAATTPQPFTFSNVGRVTVTEFQPAKQEDIEDYRDMRYPQWLSDCQAFFEYLHHRLNARVAKPTLSFEVCNTGTRPAAQSLVRFVAMGNIEILPVPVPVQDENEDENEKVSPEPLRLPSPPTPPRGKWVKQSGIFDIMSRFGDPIGVMSRHKRLNLPEILSRHPKPRDPDAFYYKGGKPKSPQELVELTCENWRHNISPEIFDFEVYGATAGDVSAALKFEVHADNLTDPVQVTVPVSLKQRTKSTLRAARKFIEASRRQPSK